MPSSVKPRLLAKVMNFSLTSALGVWVRPGAGRRSLQPPLVCSIPALPLLLRLGRPQTPPRVEPQAGQWARHGARTVQCGHVEVLARASDTLGGEQGIGLIVRLYHRHLVGVAPVWKPRRQPREAQCPQTRRAQKIRGAWDRHNPHSHSPLGRRKDGRGEVTPGRGKEGRGPGVQSCLRSEGSAGHRQLQRALHGGCWADPGRPWWGGHPLTLPCTAGQGVAQSPSQQASLLAALTRAGVGVAARGAGRAKH